MGTSDQMILDSSIVQIVNQGTPVFICNYMMFE